MQKRPVNRKFLVGGMLLILAGLAFVKLAPHLTLDGVKSSLNALVDYRNANPGRAEFIYFLIYIMATALSVPGAGVLTLAAGALFGFTWGLILVSLASTIGATFSFWIVRYLLNDFAREKFKSVFIKIDEGIRKEGALYLLSLRLIPLFPFFVVNAVMGLTPIPIWVYFWVSLVGMLPGTALYVWAGLEISQISNASDIISTETVIVFSLLGLFPWFIKLIFREYDRYQIYRRFEKPKSFEFNLVVIGAGAGGLVATATARVMKAKVAIIEKGKMGGDCLNYGCVPSKTLLHIAREWHSVKRHLPSDSQLNYHEIRKKISSAIRSIEPHDSVERFQKLGAEVLKGEARLLSPWEVQVGSRLLTARHIIIASGAAPRIPKIPGLEAVDSRTSETIWDLEDLPKRLLVVGGGAIGCELAQAFSRLGSQVTLVEGGERLLAQEDPAVSEILQKTLTSEGIKIHLRCEVEKFVGPKQALLKSPSGNLSIDFDTVLLALGRRPRVEGFGLEDLGLTLTERGTLERNEFLQTNYPNILVCGDVAGPFQLTHAAGQQGWYAAMNALLGDFWRFKEDLRVMPRCTFTSPEVASVGLTASQARDLSGTFDETVFNLEDFDRALCDGKTAGFVKVLTEKGKDRILGVTIVAEHAGDMLSEWTFAMRWNLGLKKILGTIHPYPTWSEANKLAALDWQRARIPQKLIKVSEAYQAWRRGQNKGLPRTVSN